MEMGLNPCDPGWGAVILATRGSPPSVSASGVHPCRQEADRSEDEGAGGARREGQGGVSGLPELPAGQRPPQPGRGVWQRGRAAAGRRGHGEGHRGIPRNLSARGTGREAVSGDPIPPSATCLLRASVSPFSLLLTRLHPQTSNTLCWALYHLSRDLGIQDTLYQELKAVVPPDRFPGAEDIPKMPMLRAVIKETLRYSPCSPLGWGEKSWVGTACSPTRGHVFSGGPREWDVGALARVQSWLTAPWGRIQPPTSSLVREMELPSGRRYSP